MCDAEAKLSIVGAVQLIQDYVSEFFGVLSIDQTSMKAKRGAMWVFTKNKLNVARSLWWNENFEVQCFVSSLSTVKMVIDTVFEKDKQVVMRSQIEACVVDLSTQKIRRITNDILSPNLAEISPIKPTFSKLWDINVNQYQFSNVVEVRSTNIDFCKHTNNTEYVRFIIDTFSVADLAKHPITEFEICYLAQTFEYDKLQILKKVENNTTTVLLCKNSENVVFSRITQKI